MTTPGHNGGGITPERVKEAVGRIENLAEQKLALHMAYMADCAVINEDIAGIYDDAKEHGIPKKELKKVVKTREMQRKMDAIREDLEDDARETYDQIRHALGDLADLPLGEATLARQQERDGAVDSLTDKSH